MTEAAASRAAAATAPSRPATLRFDPVSMTLHWLTVLLVAGQLTTAWLLSQAGDDGGAALWLLTAHRSMGLVTWTVVLGRVGWRLGFARLPPFPPSLPPLQRLAARLNEYALYALLALQPLTGLGDTIFRGHAFSVFIWRVPPLVFADKPVFHAFHAAHEIGAIALLGFIGLHAAAALLHGLVLRDGIIQRMWPKL